MKLNKTKSCLFAKMNEVDKTLQEKKKEKVYVTNIGNNEGNIIDSIDVKKIIMGYY